MPRSCATQWGGYRGLGGLADVGRGTYDLIVGSQLCRLHLRSGDLSEALGYIGACREISDAAIADAARSGEGKLEVVHQVSDLHGMKAVCLMRMRGGGSGLGGGAGR